MYFIVFLQTVSYTFSVGALSILELWLLTNKQIKSLESKISTFCFCLKIPYWGPSDSTVGWWLLCMLWFNTWQTICCLEPHQDYPCTQPAVTLKLIHFKENNEDTIICMNLLVALPSIYLMEIKLFKCRHSRYYLHY